MTSCASIADLTALLGDLEEPRSAQLALDMASAAIRSYTRQTISLITDDEITLVGNATRQLVLPERPVVSVSAVHINGTPIGAATYQLVRDVLWWGNTRLNVANATDDLGYGWGSASTPVQVTYTHGYATVPQDIRSACIMLASRILTQPTLVASEAIGGYSVSYGNSESGLALSETERSLLDRYRKTWL